MSSRYRPSCDQGHHVADPKTGCCPCGWVNRSTGQNELIPSEKPSIRDSPGALFPDPVDRALAADALEKTEEACTHPVRTAPDLDESQRQLVILAIAELALRRPGLDYALALIAEKLGGKDLYAEFKVSSADPSHPFREICRG